MKQIILVAAIIGFTQFACSRNNADGPAPTSLAGQWRMVSVQDNSSGAMSAKPGDIKGDVDVIFNAGSTTNGNITGKTPTNDIWPSNYQTGANRSLAIPALAITKVMETSWGLEFVNNICSSQSYELRSGGLLSIKTANKTLTFKKF